MLLEESARALGTARHHSAGMPNGLHHGALDFGNDITQVGQQNERGRQLRRPILGSRARSLPARVALLNQGQLSGLSHASREESEGSIPSLVHLP